MKAGLAQDVDDLELAKIALRQVLKDKDAPAAAKAAAARTMLEVNGALGRNALPLAEHGKAPSEMSRADLEAELASLGE